MTNCDVTINYASHLPKNSTDDDDSVMSLLLCLTTGACGWLTTEGGRRTSQPPYSSEQLTMSLQASMHLTQMS